MHRFLNFCHLRGFFHPSLLFLANEGEQFTSCIPFEMEPAMTHVNFSVWICKPAIESQHMKCILSKQVENQLSTNQFTTSSSNSRTMLEKMQRLPSLGPGSPTLFPRANPSLWSSPRWLRNRLILWRSLNLLKNRCIWIISPFWTSNRMQMPIRSCLSPSLILVSSYHFNFIENI